MESLDAGLGPDNVKGDPGAYAQPGLADDASALHFKLAVYRELPLFNSNADALRDSALDRRQQARPEPPAAPSLNPPITICTLAEPLRYMAEAITIPSPSVFLSSPVEAAPQHHNTNPPAKRRPSTTPSKAKPVDGDAANITNGAITKRKQSKSRNGMSLLILTADKLRPMVPSIHDDRER